MIYPVPISWSVNDVMTWKHFPQEWPFVRGIHRWPIDSQTISGENAGFDVFSVVSPNKVLNTQLRCRWFDTLCDVTVISLVYVMPVRTYACPPSLHTQRTMRVDSINVWVQILSIFLSQFVYIGVVFVRKLTCDVLRESVNSRHRLALMWSYIKRWGSWCWNSMEAFSELPEPSLQPGLLHELLIHVLENIDKIVAHMMNNDHITCIRSHFCTCHDSWAVVTCAKLWPDLTITIKIVNKNIKQYELINRL